MKLSLCPSVVNLSAQAVNDSFFQDKHMILFGISNQILASICMKNGASRLQQPFTCRHLYFFVYLEKDERRSVVCRKLFNTCFD